MKNNKPSLVELAGEWWSDMSLKDKSKILPDDKDLSTVTIEDVVDLYIDLLIKT